MVEFEKRLLKKQEKLQNKGHSSRNKIAAVAAGGLGLLTFAFSKYMMYKK